MLIINMTAEKFHVRARIQNVIIGLLPLPSLSSAEMNKNYLNV